MSKDQREQAVVDVLAANGATAPNVDTDTLATRIVAAIDNVAAVADTSPTGGASSSAPVASTVPDTAVPDTPA